MNDQCIIIIDPQKDFTSKDGAYAQRHPQIHEIKKATERIQQLLNTKQQYDRVVVYSNYKPGQFGENLPMCIPGTEGHELGIEVSPDVIILSKTQHSAFTDPAFSAFLKEKNHRQLFLAGFLAEYCVKQTALDAMQHGYKITLISDCMATGDDVHERLIGVLSELKEKGAAIISSDQMLSL